MAEAKFSLGQVVITPNALNTLIAEDFHAASEYVVSIVVIFSRRKNREDSHAPKRFKKRIKTLR